jgi:hypothetical protein
MDSNAMLVAVAEVQSSWAELAMVMAKGSFLLLGLDHD